MSKAVKPTAELPEFYRAAVRRGRADHMRGKSRDAVPYKDRERAELWERGWNYQQAKGAKK